MPYFFLDTMKESSNLIQGRGKAVFNQQLVNLRINFAFKQLFVTNGSEDILLAFLNAR
ncbi:MAG: hypothetical protein O7D30_08730 [Rickettsia endosymbiont of Ixodes persulcatus]|nr:hypothetical protein [Rickettsia endosymbiont of Ixodes persulcatus]